MPTLASNFITLIDVMKNTGASSEAAVAEILSQTNPILDDAVFTECNMGMIHRHKIRTGLPSVSWGQLYKGTPQSKSTVQQVDDTTGFVEGMSTVDRRLKDLQKDWASYRLSEAKSFLEAMNQEVASGIFYHNTDTAPEKIKGLAARYGVYASGSNNQGAEQQVVHGGGSGSDNTSIWFVTWGDMFTTLLYPQGTKAGIQREDHPNQRVIDGSGNPYYVDEEKFTWHVGVAVRDWRYNCRIANIDVSDMQSGSVDLYKLLTTGYYRLQSRRVAGGKTVIYCNRTVLESLDNLATGAGSAANAKLQLRKEEIQGKEVVSWRGIPIRETDALLNSEALVPAAS